VRKRGSVQGPGFWERLISAGKRSGGEVNFVRKRTRVRTSRQGRRGQEEGNVYGEKGEGGFLRPKKKGFPGNRERPLAVAGKNPAALGKRKRKLHKKPGRENQCYYKDFIQGKVYSEENYRKGKSYQHGGGFLKRRKAMSAAGQGKMGKRPDKEKARKSPAHQKRICPRK